MTSSLMRSWITCALLGALLCSLAGSARAQSSADLDDRWVPALTTGLMIFRYEADGEIDSSVQFSDRGSDDKTQATFQIGLDLKSPVLEGLPWKPRVALFGGLQAGPNQDISVTGVGQLLPDQPDAAIKKSPDEADPSVYPGQGSELIGTYESIGWYLGAGLVFELPTRPVVTIRPFVTYQGEQADMKGEIVEVQGTPGNYFIVRDKATDDSVFHYIGPGIEIETLIAPGDYIGVSLYATFDFLWSVGDDSVGFSDSLASYEYETDSFKPRGGLGVRLSWLGGF